MIEFEGKPRLDWTGLWPLSCHACTRLFPFSVRWVSVGGAGMRFLSGGYWSFAAFSGDGLRFPYISRLR